jgi:hypothetical protein
MVKVLVLICSDMIMHARFSIPKASVLDYFWTLTLFPRQAMFLVKTWASAYFWLT